MANTCVHSLVERRMAIGGDIVPESQTSNTHAYVAQNRRQFRLKYKIGIDTDSIVLTLCVGKKLLYVIVHEYCARHCLYPKYCRRPILTQ